MSNDMEKHIESVVTGWPQVNLIACKVCGVLLWDIEKHWAHAHAIEQGGIK